MNCRQVRYSLPEYIESGLPGDVTIRDHLDTCSNCRRLLTELEQLYSELRVKPERHVPDHYWITLLPRIHQRIEERQRSFRLPRWAIRYAILSVVVIAIVVSFQVFGPERQEGEGLQAVVEQMDESEFREAADVYAPFEGYVVPVGDNDWFSGDAEVFRELLGSSAVTQWETERESAEPEQFSEEQLNDLLTALDQKRFVR